ncbi:hypothetical protein Tco_1120355 [Tanacetum coccineum]
MEMLNVLGAWKCFGEMKMKRSVSNTDYDHRLLVENVSWKNVQSTSPTPLIGFLSFEYGVCVNGQSQYFKGTRTWHDEEVATVLCLSAGVRQRRKSHKGRRKSSRTRNQRTEQSSVVTDGLIHSAGSPAANHQRFFATRIRVALTSGSTQEPEKSQHDHPPTVVPQFLDLVKKILDDEPGHNHGVVDLTGDEDLTDEDGDTRMGDSIGVSVSLGGEIFSEGKEYRESNIGDSDNTEDGDKTTGEIDSEEKRSLVKSSEESGEIFPGVTQE